MALKSINQVLNKIVTVFNVEPETVMREGIELWLAKRREEILEEIEGILSKYGVGSVDELERKIADGDVPEHPAWEDLIEVENLLEGLKKIEELLDDLRKS